MGLLPHALAACLFVVSPWIPKPGDDFGDFAPLFCVVVGLGLVLAATAVGLFGVIVAFVAFKLKQDTNSR